MEQEQAYIDILAKELGMELTVSSTGAVTLVQEGRIVLLQWNAAENSFVVYVELGHLAGFNDSAVCRQLLSANFLLMESGGGALSYDSVNNMVGFNYALPVYGLSPEEFLQKMNAILLLAEEWKDTFSKMKAEQEELAAQALSEAENAESDLPQDDMALTMQFVRV